MPLGSLGAGSGYQLPKVGGGGGYTGGNGKLLGIARGNAQLQQYSPEAQRAQFQLDASKQAADPNSDPMQNFYNAQQLKTMRMNSAAEEEARKAAITQKWGQAYGLAQGGGGQGGGGG